MRHALSQGLLLAALAFACVQNGRNPAMVKSIEFSNVFIFEKEAKRMPWSVLHELSHAYHDQVLGGDHAGITAAYAMEGILRGARLAEGASAKTANRAGPP